MDVLASIWMHFVNDLFAKQSPSGPVDLVLIILLHRCSSPATQLQRVCERNNYDAATAQQRINAQMPLAEKCKRATIVVDNDGTVDALNVQADQVYAQLRASKAHWKLRLALVSVLSGMIFLAWHLSSTIVVTFLL